MDALRGGAVPASTAPLPPEEVGPEARALILLRELPGVGFVVLERLLETFGSGRDALGASRKAFAGIAGTAAARARAERSREAEVRSVMRRCRSLAIDVLPRGAEGYPARLLHLAQPPAVLFLRGNASLLGRTTVTVVGSRRSSAYGRRAASEIVRVLVPRNVVVASGLALGIDAAAHRATLEAGGATLAVLGSGPDVPHPPSNRGLFRRIGREGLLVSEFLPGTGPQPHHFPRRNRILAALARGVVVVEAARRSGALITSELALELGRTVAAVPGPIFAERSRGTNRLIRDGAVFLSEPEDVLQILQGPQGPRGDAPEPGAPVGLGPDALVVWSALEGGVRGVDDLARAGGLGSARTLSALAGLELGGWVEREPGMRFRRSVARAGPEVGTAALWP